jgi:hypothetical protein
VVVVVVVAVAATGAGEARGGWWGGLSVPKPPEGVAGSETEAGAPNMSFSLGLSCAHTAVALPATIRIASTGRLRFIATCSPARPW